METKNRLTSSQRTSIVQKYQDGTPIVQLSKDFNVSRPTVYKILSKANLTLKNELFLEKYKENKEMENTTFLGVTIDTINGPLDFKIKKALKQSVKLLDIMEFIKVTKFKLNMTMFDYFWQVVVGKTPGHIARRTLEWFGYDGEYSEQKRLFMRMLKNNDINFKELNQGNSEIDMFPTIKEELALIPSNVKNSKFLIMEPNDLKMAIMQLKTKNGHIIRQYYIDLEELLKIYVEYTLYFNHRESQRKITDLEQMMARMDLEREKDRQMMQRQEDLLVQQSNYMRSLGITLEEVKDQNSELLEKNEEITKKADSIQRKLGIAFEDRAPLPLSKSKQERFVLLKRNDPEYYPYYTIRAQNDYTNRKLKNERANFEHLEVLIDLKCNPNSKTLFIRIKEKLKDMGVTFDGNNLSLNNAITEEELIEEMKLINDLKYDP